MSPAHDDARRTIGGLVGAMLGILPLSALFTDQQWLLLAWFIMGLTLMPAALIRVWQPARAWQLFPGLALAIEWLLLRTAPDHMWATLVPTPATWHDVTALSDSLRDTLVNDSAPVTPTPATTLAAGLAALLLALFVDLLATQAGYAGLAGVPLLIIFMMASTVPRHPVNWWLFAAAAVGYLLILAIDARAELLRWGPVIGRADPGRRTLIPAVRAQRIGALTIVTALVLAVLAPLHGGNWLSRLLSTGSGGSGTGGGSGGGSSLDIAAFASLRGQLARPDPTPVMRVRLSGNGTDSAYYLRTNVLTDYTGQGWKAGGPAVETPARDGQYVPTLPAGEGTTSQFRADITPVVGGSVAPVFAIPDTITGLPDSARWVPSQQIVRARVQSGSAYTETVTQPAPSVQELEDAPPIRSDLAALTELTTPVPAQVRAITASIVDGLTSEYARARAIASYFLDPANGFQYSLSTRAGDTGSELLDFLTNKIGYCQQFAAAATVMMRLAGVPARVALGYTHPNPDVDGRMTITTTNAHAWTEVYFIGLGWVPFDATPQAGAPGASTTSLPWLTNGAATGPGATAPSGSAGSASSSARIPRGAQEPTTPAGSAIAGGRGAMGWVLLISALIVTLLVILFAIPGLLRLVGRRRRLAAGRSGDSEQLWRELSATAVDLGYVWSDARTPRQVESWLRQRTGTDAGRSLVQAVEVARYARPSAGDGDRTGTAADDGASTSAGTGGQAAVVADLREVETLLRSSRSARSRVRARLLPRSLGWWITGKTRR